MIIKYLANAFKLDVFRWIIALLLLPFFIWYSFLLVNSYFEYMVPHISVSHPFLYSLALVVMAQPVLFFDYILVFLIFYYCRIVRQTRTLGLVVRIAFTIIVVITIYIAWSQTLTFSWEHYPHTEYNRYAFTILMLGFLGSAAFAFIEEQDQ